MKTTFIATYFQNPVREDVSIFLNGWLKRERDLFLFFVNKSIYCPFLNERDL
jgi:hypothetical protein